MRIRHPIAASIVLTLLGALPELAPGAHAQAASLYYRASIAYAVDSLAQTAEKTVNDPLVKRVRDFVANPFTTLNAPTVEELNDAYAIVKNLNDTEEGEGSEFDLFTGAGAAAGALGGLPTQAELLAGLANFMVRRAQDELVFSFVDNLRLRIAGNTDVALVVNTVMPSSYAILQAVEPTTFQVLLPQLRTAAETDIRELPVRVGEPDVLTRLGITGERRNTVQAASIVFQRVKEMRGGVHPATALANLRDLDATTLESERLRTPLVVIGVVAREYSVHADSLRGVMGVLGKRQVFARYLAEDLVEQQGLAGKKQQVLDMVQKRQADLQQLVEEIHQIDERVKDVRQAADTAAARAGAAGTIDAAITLLAGARRYVIGTEAAPAFTFVENARMLNDAWSRRDYPALLGWLTTQLQGSTVAQPVREQTLRYLSFATSLASAQNAQQVTVALRAAAGPVGSYRLKRRQEENERQPVAFFLTGFVGATSGFEYAQRDSAGNGGGALHLGASVPVGLEAAWPVKGGSLSLFVPVIDLGNLANVRIGGGDVEASPEMGFRQVFAPGVYGIWGMGRNSPTVLGVGIQAAPGLRRPSSGGSALDVWRISLLFGIDVTLLRL